MSEKDITSARESRLGEWYYGAGRKLLGREQAYKELEKPHIEVHDIAKKAVIAFNRGDKQAAESQLQQVLIREKQMHTNE